MNARGSTEVIVATIGLSMGALSENLFTMIVAMAVATTMAMPPMLRWALARVPMRKAEKERLEREEFEAKEFIPNLERMLLAVDQSPNGKFAARLAGLIAGPRGLPTTVLPLSETAKNKAKGRGKQEEKEDAEEHDRAGEGVKAAAEESKQRQISEDGPGPVDVTVRRLDASSEEAVAKEAKKGYDLLLMGVANTATNGAFHPNVTRIAAAFEGPLAITVGKGIHLRQPERSPLHILVPVNGADVSRRAAEVAIAIAHACNCPVAALYVAHGATDNPRKRRGFRARQQEQAIMKDFVEMADRYDVKAKTAVRADLAPDKAILAELKEANHDLIIMGAGRRPGDKLFFGDTAAAVLEKSPASILFVAT
jgi:nucleotide-binding universal stress UspA family protein